MRFITRSRFVFMLLFAGGGLVPNFFADDPQQSGPAWEQAGMMAGQGASEVSDSLGAANEALEVGKAPFNSASAREALARSGSAFHDATGTLRDSVTGKVISRAQVQGTANSLNRFNAAQNEIKGNWKGTKENLGKAADLAGKMDKAGVYGQAAGELAGGDIVGGTSTLVNDRLSDVAKAGGAWGGGQAGALAGGAMFGPPGAVAGGVVGGAYGAWKGGKVYDQYGKVVVDAGLNKGAEIYYGDPRGSDPQGRADINAENANLTPEALARMQQLEKLRSSLSPEAFAVWKRVWGRSKPVVGPPSMDDLRDPEFQKALTKIKTGIYESNRDHPDGYGPVRIDPDGRLAAAEKSVLDRIAALEKDVEWEVAEDERARREWARQEELARLQAEQQRIAAEREQNARDAAQAGQALETMGAILGAMGQGMNQPPPQEPMQNHQHPAGGAPGRFEGTTQGHMRPDGTWDPTGN